MKSDHPYPLVENLAFGKWVTPEQNQKLPIYRWFNLNHSYSRNLVISLLEEYNFHSGQIVLDPFCGSGTTLLACREMGINALGVDIMPLSVFTSNSKLKPYAKQKISCDYEQIYPSRQYDFGFETADPYLHKCFPLDELTKLLHLRYTIASMSEPERNFFALALLKILEEISYTMNDGAFLRFSNQKRLKTLEQTFPQQVKLMMEDLETQKPNRTSAVTVQGDARCIPFKDRSVDGVITSPPYPNRHDYTRIYAVELLFSFLNNREELKRLRYSMIRSNVEARCVVRIKGYRPPTRLEKLLFRLKQCHLPNRKVVDMVSGYFEDMYGVMVEIARVCKSGAKIAFTVGNAKYGGIMFPVDELLAEIGENAGLKTVKIIVARYRGNSPQQMKKFGKESARESIIIWEREK